MNKNKNISLELSGFMSLCISLLYTDITPAQKKFVSSCKCDLYCMCSSGNCNRLMQYSHTYDHFLTPKTKCVTVKKPFPQQFSQALQSNNTQNTIKATCLKISILNSTVIDQKQIKITVGILQIKSVRCIWKHNGKGVHTRSM